MTRPTMSTTLLDMARVMAKRSTCARSQVGSLFALEGRILSSGYNGAPTGLAHCDHACSDECGGDVRSPGYHDDLCPKVAPCEVAVHAEANAIAFAAKNGVTLDGSTLYTTHSPCFKCTQLIINVGVVHVVIGKLYRERSGLLVLDRLNIPVTTASGAPWRRLVGVDV